MKDGYEFFFEYFKCITNEKMIEFGLKNLICTPTNVANDQWEILKKKLNNNERLYIRGYGREAKGTYLYQELYSSLFNNSNIEKDASSNGVPRKCMEEWTMHKKKPTKQDLKNGFIHIQNFQISHVFGQTKNPLLFTAPWNIVIIPKVMDPFTGHEAHGELNKLFSKELQKFIYDKYKDQIDDYNKMLTKDFYKKIEAHVEQLETRKISNNNNTDHLNKVDFDVFLKHVLKEWSPIQVK